MSDSSNSTLSSSFHEDLNQLLVNGFPALDGPSDENLRRQGEDLAMAVAYTWVHHDRAAQDVFLNRLLEPNTSGLGLMIAIEVYTEARLFGIQPGALRPNQQVTTRWTPDTDSPQHGGAASSDGGDSGSGDGCLVLPDRTKENLAVITNLWTGIATGNHPQWMRAKAELYEMPTEQVREVLRIMAYDTSCGMNQFAIWQAGGADALDDYRSKVPLENTLRPPLTAAQP